MKDRALQTAEITFCVRGVITEPCGVPTLVSDHSPSSDTPAFSHFWMRRSIRRSATRCSMNFIVHSWLILSKETTTHYPPSALPRARDHHASASPLPRTIAGGPAASPHARWLAVRTH